MSTFTAVDLSRLPAPDIVEQLDFEAIFQAMLARLVQLAPEFSALTESDFAFKVLQVAAYREMQIRQDFNDRARGVMLAYAGGADLDHLGALMGVQRYLLTPANPLTQAPAVYEDDAAFRRRIQLAPEGFSVAGPAGAYIFHALSAHADVLDASATSPAPGEVVVSVLARSGNGTPSAAVVEAVRTALTDEDVRPMTDNVTVEAAEILAYVVEATLYTYAGPDSALVLSTARTRLDRYVAESHRLGRDVTRSGLYAALHIDGVQRVVLTAPAQDIVATPRQAGYCNVITLNHGGVDE